MHLFAHTQVYYYAYVPVIIVMVNTFTFSVINELEARFTSTVV